MALLFETQSLTYGDLNARANRLAHHLINLGLGPESLVGVCLERSIEMVVGLLAILKAGGAYVPLAPDLPTLRRDSLIADTGLRHILTTRAYRSLLADRINHVVVLDDNTCSLSSNRQDNPEVALLPSNLAYLNYTSGTTGGPKAVAVTHVGVVRLVKQPNYVRLMPSRLLQMAPTKLRCRHV